VRISRICEALWISLQPPVLILNKKQIRNRLVSQTKGMWTDYAKEICQKDIDVLNKI